MIRPQKKYRQRHTKTLIVLIVVFVTVFVGIYWQQQRQDSSAKRQMKDVVAEVSKHIILPTDEEPTLVTVEDKTKVTDVFLKQAENGDKILLYPNAKKVYLYRPGISRLVDVGPLIVDPVVAEVDGTKVAIYIGTSNGQKVHDIIDRLKLKYPTVTLAQQKEAKRVDYPSTIVIDLTDNKKYNLVNSIAQNLNIQAGVLPIGEQKPDADILILVGEN
jgi:hypothetical protein